MSLPVSTIAASVGFIDALAFSKKFSKTYQHNIVNKQMKRRIESIQFFFFIISFE